MGETIEPLDEELLVRPYMYGRMFAALLVVYAIYWYFWREELVLSFEDIWTTRGTMGDAFGSVWGIFLWAFSVTAVVMIVCIVKKVPRSHEPSETFLRGMWISVNAGFFEEIIFRWLVFFCAMMSLPFFDWLTLGFVEWLYTEVLIPLANWATFGALEYELTEQHYWVLGAAIISSNAEFRKVHFLNGPIGWINSWFIGMALFYVMLNFGMWPAIAVHIVYDAIIYTVLAVGNAMSPKQRYSRFTLPSMRY